MPALLKIETSAVSEPKYCFKPLPGVNDIGKFPVTMSKSKDLSRSVICALSIFVCLAFTPNDFKFSIKGSIILVKA